MSTVIGLLAAGLLISWIGWYIVQALSDRESAVIEVPRDSDEE